jgi:hypothetical protein
MYLLDTDTLTHLHAGNSNVLARLKSAIDVEVGITIPRLKFYEDESIISSKLNLEQVYLKHKSFYFGRKHF